MCLYVMIVRDNLHKVPYTIPSEMDGWIEIYLFRANCSSLSKVVDVFLRPVDALLLLRGVELKRIL